jgi:LAO/AO transport system kinase
MELVEKVLQGDEKSAARLISMIEDEKPEGLRAVELLFPHTGRAHVVGITGIPGAGKSTLIDRLATSFVAAGRKVGIIAVDPTSAVGDGALLGDRLRMTTAGKAPDVFIRSMAHRGFPGGLAKGTLAAAYVLDALGKDVIIIESVGAGQTEVQISALCHTVITVLTPEYGDEIQLMKAGLVEIGHIVAVNKADRPGAEETFMDLTAFLQQRDSGGWQIPVLKVEARRGRGIDVLAAAIDDHRVYLAQDNSYRTVRSEKLKTLTLAFLKDALWQSLLERSAMDSTFKDLIQNVTEGSMDPYTAASRALHLFERGLRMEAKA